ncbi:hypothetical protein ABVT39_025341 [Epinephelus coioides]
MLLSVAMYILLSPQYCNVLNEFAHTCLLSFVDHFSRLYGPEFVAYNVHGLVHISDDVKQHGNLDEFSAFPFENYLGKLKKLVRKPDNPLAQIIRRLSEMDNSTVREDCLRRVLRKEHQNGPVPPVLAGVFNQFKEVLLSGTVIRTSEGDNCVKIHNSIAIVVNIILCGGKIHLVYKEYRNRSSFFHYPMDSGDLGIFIVSDPSDELNTTVLGDSVKKKNRRFQDYDDATDSEDDGHTVSGLEPPPVIKPPQPAVVAQASAQHSSSYHAVKEPLTAFSQESYQQHIKHISLQSSFFQLTDQPIHSSENYQQISYLGLIGGFNLKDTVWRVMKSTISTQVARQMNWRGVNDKISLQRLVLKTIIIDAVRRNPVTGSVSDKDVEVMMVKWLHLAGDRDGGRKQRQKNADEKKRAEADS